MRKLVPILAALLLFAAACGSSSGSDKASKTDAGSSTTAAKAGDDDAGSGSSTADAAMIKAAGLTGTVNDHGTASVADGKEVEVEMDDKYFEPTFIQAPAGTTFTVELENEGSLPHTFTADSLGIDEQVEPGKKAEVKVTMPSTSTSFQCDFHGAMGMKGGLIVPGTTAAAGSSDDATTTTMSSGTGSGY